MRESVLQLTDLIRCPLFSAAVSTWKYGKSTAPLYTAELEKGGRVGEKKENQRNEVPRSARFLFPPFNYRQIIYPSIKHYGNTSREWKINFIPGLSRTQPESSRSLSSLVRPSPPEFVNIHSCGGMTGLDNAYLVAEITR